MRSRSPITKANRPQTKLFTRATMIVQACTLRLTPRRSFSSMSMRVRDAMRKSGAPRSIALIRDEGVDVEGAPAFIRSIGSTRRVFLLRPHMTANEMEGLAYRLETLTKNDALSSVLIATDNNDDVENGALPSFMVDRNSLVMRDESVDEGLPPVPGQTFYVSAGYDPMELFKSNKYKNKEYLDHLFTSLSSLGDACAGSTKTKIPTIVVPHGVVTDGGFVWLRGSYVLATRETSFRIMNPSRGLSLDPVGLSYFLTRIGKEFNQDSKKHTRGCAFLLALAGYEANHTDLLETGLVTQAMESPESLGLLEHTLSEIQPWNQQALVKKQKQYYGQISPVSYDSNHLFRNTQVADTVRCFSNGSADNLDFMNFQGDNFDIEDPSIEYDPVPWEEERVSDLVEIAAAFTHLLDAKDLKGRMDRIHDFSMKVVDNAQDQVMVDVAKQLDERLGEQSPLALSVIHRLLVLASGEYSKLEDCILRERRTQMAMMQLPDFSRWAQHNEGGVYKGPWEHKSVHDVSDDQVMEIIESNQEDVSPGLRANSLL